MTINAVAQTNDIKRAFEIKNNLLEATVLAYQELPNKDRVFLCAHIDTLSYRYNYYVQCENSKGELIYKSNFTNRINTPCGGPLGGLIDFATTQKGIIILFGGGCYSVPFSVNSTSDGGNTWKQNNLGHSPFLPQIISPIRRLNENVILFYYNHIRENPQIYITYDGGTTWEIKTLNTTIKEPINIGIMKINCTKKGKITVSCKYTNNENKDIGTQKFISKDFGKTFK